MMGARRAGVGLCGAVAPARTLLARTREFRHVVFEDVGSDNSGLLTRPKLKVRGLHT